LCHSSVPAMLGDANKQHHPTTTRRGRWYQGWTTTMLNDTVPIHAYELLLVGWCLPQGCEGGGRWHPSTCPPPLRALAHRVDWVLTAMAPHNDDEWHSTRPHAYEPLLVGWIVGADQMMQNNMKTTITTTWPPPPPQ